jgi:hypothetical protein
MADRLDDALVALRSVAGRGDDEGAAGECALSDRLEHLGERRAERYVGTERHRDDLAAARERPVDPREDLSVRAAAAVGQHLARVICAS